MQHPKAAGVRFKGNRDPHPIESKTRARSYETYHVADFQTVPVEAAIAFFAICPPGICN
jgi:hypothetical protein